MFQTLKRILMNQVDASPGGGAPAQGSPVVPPAQGGPPAIDRATEEALIKRGRDAAYAELRRSGALKRSFMSGDDNKGKDKEKDDDEGDKPTAPDPMLFRRLDRALGRSGFAPKLQDRAYARMEREFAADKPEDADAWIKDYFEGLGFAPPAASDKKTESAATATQQKPLAERPVTDRGAIAPTQTTSAEDLYLPTASEADRKAAIEKKGLIWYRDTLNKQLRGVKVSLR